MNKCDFLTRLALELKGLPQEDAERWLEYYKEMLEDRIEDGVSEQEAVASLGAPRDIAKEILAQTPFTRLIKNKVRPKRKLLVWEILLICIGAPIWMSIAISLVAVILSVFLSLWACIVSIWATELALGVSGIALVIGAFLLIGSGAVYQGLLLLGGGLVCAGLSYFGFFLCKWLTVLLAKLCKLFALFVKSLFVAKEGKK